jgi:hypothetical protein
MSNGRRPRGPWGQNVHNQSPSIWLRLVTGPAAVAVVLIKPERQARHDDDQVALKPTVVESVKLQSILAAIVKILGAGQIEYAVQRANSYDAQDSALRVRRVRRTRKAGTTSYAGILCM